MKALFMWFLFLSFLKFLFPFNLARVDLSLFEAFSSEGYHSGFPVLTEILVFGFLREFPRVSSALKYLRMKGVSS